MHDRISQNRIGLNLRQLEAFVATASTESFRQAALRTKQSQPTISRLISEAERVLGSRLFDRDTRHVELTTTGRELLPIARRILLEFDDSMSDLGKFLAGQTGRISIAALPSIAASLLPSAIATYMRKFPQVTFQLHEAATGRLLRMVEERGVDFGVCARPDAMQSLRYRHLTNDPFVLVCAHGDPLAQRESVSWNAFSGRRCVISTMHTSIRAVTDAVFMRLSRPVRAVLEVPSAAAAIALTGVGVGVCAMPKLTLAPLNMSMVRTVALRDPVMNRPIGVVTHIGRSLSPAAQAFIAELEAQSAPEANRLAKEKDSIA